MTPVSLPLPRCWCCGGVLDRPSEPDEFDGPDTVQCGSCKRRFRISMWSSGAFAAEAERAARLTSNPPSDRVAATVDWLTKRR